MPLAFEALQLPAVLDAAQPDAEELALTAVAAALFVPHQLADELALAPHQFELATTEVAAAVSVLIHVLEALGVA